MKITPWAGLGALAVLLALPATAPAMGDAQPSPIRARRVTVVTAERLGAAPVAQESAPVRREGVLSTDPVISPALPGVADRAPEELDVPLLRDANVLPEAADFHVLDAPVAAPRLSSELRAIVRAEEACLFALDLPVAQ